MIILIFLCYELCYHAVTSMQCLQCAMLEGWPTVCPDDGVLESLEVWDACMTWTLDNGTVVLQNFVMAEDDCTEDRLEFWGKKYLDIVWNSTGTAECCYEDGCNDNRPNTTTVVTTPSTSPTFQETSRVHPTSLQPITNTEEYTANEETKATDSIDEVKNEKSQCDQCKDIEYSECIDDKIGVFRLQGFGEMVKKMARINRHLKCSCKTGFLPLYTNGVLEKCVDPIIKTSGIYGRCLVQEHCDGLMNAECMLDKELAEYQGFEDYKTCQCKRNTETAEVDDDGLITQCVPRYDIGESVCEKDSDCDIFGNAYCSKSDEEIGNSDDENENPEKDRTETGAGEEDESGSSSNNMNNNINNNGRKKRESFSCVCKEGSVYDKTQCKSERVANQEFPVIDFEEKPSIGQECLMNSDCLVTNSICVKEQGSNENTNEVSTAPSENNSNGKEPPNCPGGTNTNCNNGVCTITCSGSNNNNNNNNNGRVVREAGGMCGCKPGYRPVLDKSNYLTGCLSEEIGRPETQLSFLQDLPEPPINEEKGDRFAQESQEDEKEPNKENLNEILDAVTEDQKELEPSTESKDEQLDITSHEREKTTLRIDDDDKTTKIANEAEKEPSSGLFTELIPDEDGTTESGIKSCRLEFNQGLAKPFKEPITQTAVSVFFLKWDSSPRNGDGAVVRMSLNEAKERFYSFHILKNRRLSISVGTASYGKIRVRKVAATRIDTEINRLYWSEWWVAYKSGKILIGTVEDHDLTNPLLAWIDHDHPLPAIEVIEFDGYRTKAKFKADCFENILRPDACSANSDCDQLPKTQCRTTEDDIVGIYKATCQCMPGYHPIPSPVRNAAVGCYDPIVTTQTVGGKCTDQRHCAALPNTECTPVQGMSVCQCKRRTRPRTPDPATGLVLGCQVDDKRVSESRDSCMSESKLYRDKDWVPGFRVPLEEDEISAGAYKTAFYARFPEAGSLIVRLISEDLDQEHLYSVHYTTDGTISIYDNYVLKHWIGNFPKEVLKKQGKGFTQITELNSWVGLWVKVRFLPHTGTTIHAGVLGSEHGAVEWTDSSETAIQNIAFTGFGTYTNVEVFADCYLT